MDPVTHRIVDTREGGKVAITQPSPRCFRVFRCGGVGPKDSEFYYAMNRRGFIAEQIRRHVERGVAHGVAVRWVYAMMAGGCTSGESWDLFRGYSCFNGTGHEIVAVAELPPKSLFRDAWRRLPEGGPIWIDMPTARAIQMKMIEAAAETWNKRAVDDDDAAFFAGRMTNGPAVVEIQRGRLRQQLLAAQTPTALQQVWPEDLPRMAA